MWLQLSKVMNYVNKIARLNINPYATIEEFGENAKVDGEFLKDVWEKVYNFKLGC